LRAESHAQADLMASLDNGKGHHTANAESREQQGKHGESSEENHAETIAGHLRIHYLLHRPGMRERVSREIVSHHTAGAAGNQAWVESRSHSESGPGPGNLPVGRKNLRRRFIGRVLSVADVMKYAHDLPFRGRPDFLVGNKLPQQQALIERND
jgi:hypothetical protein